MRRNFFIILAIFLISSGVLSGTDKPQLADMAEYRKHCKVLVNLGTTYGVLMTKQQQRLVGAKLEADEYDDW